MTLIIHASETASYAIRYAGVRTGKLAVSLSLAGMVLLVSRTSNLIQAPMMGKIIDYAKMNSDYNLELPLRYIIGASSVGTFVAIAAFPSLVFVFARMIVHFDIQGSIAKVISSVTVEKLRNVRSHLRRPSFGMLVSLRIMGIPKRLLLLNCIVTAIYTVGVLASLYASYLAPELSTTASQSSGLINGIATIILTIFIDPQMALLTDKALGFPRESARLGRVFALLMFSRLAGTLLAQAMLVPATKWLIWVIQYI
ncbi:lipid II flippase Amj family protein [Paenibacillus hamazuiensis]|uniref:lipid II flippase Amj family protein n=1 Tax=Paenibacillus hamazuiensis TaxID=2936508 RepID=UPI00200C78EE|nr:lipid II flippase Amj family protein [Paenibacillus hamazuiensis]